MWHLWYRLNHSWYIWDHISQLYDFFSIIGIIPTFWLLDGMLYISQRCWETWPIIMGVIPSMKIRASLGIMYPIWRSKGAQDSKCKILGCNSWLSLQDVSLTKMWSGFSGNLTFFLWGITIGGWGTFWLVENNVEYEKLSFLCKKCKWLKIIEKLFEQS